MAGQGVQGNHRSGWRGLAVLIGTAVAVALSAIAVPGASAAFPAAAARSTRTVTYHGYTVSVPASWPVYNLADDPSRCVLLNQHAVYLGMPGANQDCPARAYGRTEALLIQPSGTAAAAGSSAQPAIVLPRDSAALPDSTGALPAAARAAVSTSHVIRIEAPGPGVVVTASYGSDPGAIRKILAGATITGTASAPAVAAAAPAAIAAPTAARAAATPGTNGGPPELTEMTGTGLGFDTCTAPSVATMTDWLASPYRVAGTYLGGSNWACDYGNFSASWVRQVAGEGWKFLPIWVGPQAPCTSLPGVTVIDPAQAAVQGEQEAASAVATAQGFGYGGGTPIYFDMESYNNSNGSCSQAVLDFLGGWTQGLHDAGYLSGVYSSAATGISDLANEYATTYPSPDAVWIADWNLEPVLTDPYVPGSDWAGHQRAHQYTGGHEETWGGSTVDIDSDISDGPVAGAPAPALSGGAAVRAEPDETVVAPGKATVIRVTLRGAGNTRAVLRWQADAPPGLSVMPARGSAYVTREAAGSFLLSVSPSNSLANGRYDIPIRVSSGSKPAAETFVLVSVAAVGSTLPTSYPVVLYAADQASMTAAARTAGELALPAGDVTGDFSQAWSDLGGGGDLVLAVGQAANNALYSNPCGWTNPAGEGAGNTPFYIPGEPLQAPPGTDAFEESDGGDANVTALLTGQLTQYALAGTFPDYGHPPVGPLPPTSACLGSPDVVVPSR
jgi:hypothetical protein